MLEFLSGKKTYIVMAATILGSIGAFASGEITVVELSAAILSALGLGSLRAGVAKAGKS